MIAAKMVFVVFDIFFWGHKFVGAAPRPCDVDWHASGKPLPTKPATQNSVC